MSRGFDHLVLTADNLTAASDVYERLGFTLTPQAQHPFGTGNRLAQLQGCFLELLSVTEPNNVPEAGAGAFSFGAYNRDYLADREGMSMLVLQTKDAKADRDNFRAAGLTTYEMFEFSRLAQLPDGTEATVGFTLAFATEPALPQAVAFTCQQWRPDLFWKPEYQRHANSAESIAEVFLVTDDATSADHFCGGLDLDPDTACVTVMTPAEMAVRFPGVDAAPRYYAGYRIAVSDLETARTCLEENAVPYEDSAKSIWVSPAHGFGCVIEFASDDEEK